MHRVKTVAEIRRDNLEILISEFDTLAALAEAAGTSSVYLSQVRNRTLDVKTKRPRELGSNMARRLEHAAKPPKPVGWMDQAHYSGLAVASRGDVRDPGPPAKIRLADLSSEERELIKHIRGMKGHKRPAR